MGELESRLKDIPWDKIDEEIRPVVKVLVDEGIETFASCSGHGKEWPWVNCKISDSYGEEDIIDALNKHGYQGFTISRSRYVTGIGHIKVPFWSILFWGEGCLKPNV